MLSLSFPPKTEVSLLNMLLVKLLLENTHGKNYEEEHYQNQASNVHLEKKQHE